MQGPTALQAGNQAPSDDELVSAVRAGAVDAFEALYRRHVGMVYGLAARLTLDGRFAEDLTQEVFVRVWQRLESFKGDSKFSTWLYRVASNVVVDAMRKRNPLVLVEEDMDVPDTTSTPAMVRDVERQLARLPERARVVLLLHDMAGMTHEEIAEQLDIAPGTSKAQLFRARKLYRELENE